MAAQAISRGRGRADQKAAAVAERKPFGLVLRDLLIDRGITTGMGNPNWRKFSDQLPDVHYETLRKAVTGDRVPSPSLMEACADALGLDPADAFYEYALWQVQRQFDPAEVGVEDALNNLRRWSSKNR